MSVAIGDRRATCVYINRIYTHWAKDTHTHTHPWLSPGVADDPVLDSRLIDPPAGHGDDVVDVRLLHVLRVQTPRVGVQLLRRHDATAAQEAPALGTLTWGAALLRGQLCLGGNDFPNQGATATVVKVGLSSWEVSLIRPQSFSYHGDHHISFKQQHHP